jgi:hypothetical protein
VTEENAKDPTDLRNAPNTNPKPLVVDAKVPADDKDMEKAKPLAPGVLRDLRDNN